MAGWPAGSSRDLFRMYDHKVGDGTPGEPVPRVRFGEDNRENGVAPFHQGTEHDIQTRAVPGVLRIFRLSQVTHEEQHFPQNSRSTITVAITQPATELSGSLPGVLFPKSLKSRPMAIGAIQYAQPLIQDLG